jgi:hypothetical protein
MGLLVLFAFLFLLGVICFVLAAFGVVARINWIALGLALCFAVFMIQAWQKVLP